MEQALSVDIGALQPVTVHGSNISCFTGKLENYLRVRGVPYTFRAMHFPRDAKWIKEKLGVMQMPVVELGDRPSLADIGLSGPFFRHFGLDPAPLREYAGVRIFDL